MQKILILFFSVFLTSRFFTETIGVAPKAIDVIDLGFVPALVALGLLLHRPTHNRREVGALSNILILVLLCIGVSALANADRLLMPAAALFSIGFLSGPLLFWGMCKTLGKGPGFDRMVTKMMMGLCVANLLVVVFINIPQFIASKNPDYISGTFGLNAYFFSGFLMIAAGYFIGLGRNGTIRTSTNIGIQIVIIVVYYLLQYRSALPFFLLAYVLVLVRTYNRQILKPVIAMFVVGYLVLQVGNLFTTRVDTDLKYDSWVELVKNPGEYMTYGKFSAYTQTVLMMGDNPAAILVGVGPGNYLSRAYYTFSHELIRGTDKGVARIIDRFLGISQPRFTAISEMYMAPTRTGAVFGSKQLSNPNSSIIAPIAEIGLLGGAIIVGMYLYLCWMGWQLVRDVKSRAPELLPLACAFLTGSVYLFGLGFLDNVWEMTRATLPVWLLFYTTLNGLRQRDAARAKSAPLETRDQPSLPNTQPAPLPTGALAPTSSSMS